MDGAVIWQSILPSLLSLFVGGGGVAWYQVRQSRLARISGDEREARRDVVADRDSLYDRVNTRLASVEQRLDDTEAENRALRSRNIALDDHIDTLESHIWRGKPAPPPPRPPLP